MKLGTIVYDNEIYNLDYMTSDEIKELINTVEADKYKNMNEGKNIVECNLRK
jgi:hypothetical protein